MSAGTLAERPAYVVETHGEQPRTHAIPYRCERCGMGFAHDIHPAVSLIDHHTYPGRCHPDRRHLEQSGQ